MSDQDLNDLYQLAYGILNLRKRITKGEVIFLAEGVKDLVTEVKKVRAEAKKP